MNEVVFWWISLIRIVVHAYVTLLPQLWRRWTCCHIKLYTKGYLLLSSHASYKKRLVNFSFQCCFVDGDWNFWGYWCNKKSCTKIISKSFMFSSCLDFISMFDEALPLSAGSLLSLLLFGAEIKCFLRILEPKSLYLLECIKCQSFGLVSGN